MAADRSIMAVEQIGRYRITGELGRGGMGVVYRGEDPLIGRQVAIKTLTEVTPELRERFYLEARSGILSHPNIVTVYELGEDEGSPFIAMEFIAGESLEKTLQRTGRLALLDTLSIVEQLCAGLGYAHARGVVHRDVKPANVLVQPDGRVTIVDFGIARLADQTRQLTKTDALLGTFHYIAPERLKGEASDGRADIWSIGVMLYEMLTGELPFKGKDISSLYRVIHEPYVPLTEHVEDLPTGLKEIVEKALAKEVGERYPTADEMALDLQVISAALKFDRVNTLLETARRLSEEQQFDSARTVLLQAQRIDPANLDIKTLLNEVQDHMTQLQRDDQLRQLVEQAQSALAERRWDDAIARFEQAQKMDTGNLFRIEERLKEAQERRLQQQKIASLWEQAREARSRGDLTGAQEYLGQALRIDEHSTDLRNAYSVILREIRRRQQALQVEELLRGARENYGRSEYTEAISRLRQAAEIDAAHSEVQQLLFTAVTRQKEERRQQLLEKIAAEIQESLDREDFAQAQDRVTRALESLPGEGLLLRLKTETEFKKREFDIQQVVREATREAQELFLDHPEEALQVIERSLEAAPGNDVLLQSKARLQEHLKKIKASSERAEALLKAHTSVETRNYIEARHILEEAVLNFGSNEELDHLLTVVKDLQAEEQQRQEHLRTADEIRKAVERAVIDFDQALATGNIKHCMRALDEVAGTRGEDAVAGVRQECENKRRRRAEQILGQVMEKSRQSLHQGNPREALRFLRKSAEVAKFAGPAISTDFEELKKNCETAARANPKNTSTAAYRRLAPKIWFIAGTVTIIAALAIEGIHLHHRKAPQPKAAMIRPVLSITKTDMEISIAPWAKVLNVQNGTGDNIALPSGDLTTPLRLDGLYTGHYKVTVAGPDGQQQTFPCEISAKEHLCAGSIEAPDMQRVLKGEQP